MQGVNQPDDSDLDVGDHLPNASNRGGPYDDLGDPSDDVTAELIRLRDMLSSDIMDEAIRAVFFILQQSPSS
jgi:hypothetical protein